MHRIAVCLEISKETEHKNIVSFIWKILKNGNKQMADTLHYRTEKYKPFVWAFHKNDSINILYFSSINEDITMAFLRGSNKILNSNIGILEDEIVFKIAKVIPLQDIGYIGKTMMVKTLSPVTISEWVEKNKKIRVLYETNKKLWINLVEQNLKRRVKTFLDRDVQYLKIEVISANAGIAVKYKNNQVCSRMFTLKLIGDEIAIFSAVYGGLGELTGSGFGMVNTI